MKFETPMYEGDSILRRGPEVSMEESSKADSTPEMVQRKITPEQAAPAAEPQPAGPLAVDIFEIERRARALRAAAIQSALANLSRWLERSFETARRRRIDEYLARARSVADLEARLRRLDRGGDLARP